MADVLTDSAHYSAIADALRLFRCQPPSIKYTPGDSGVASQMEKSIASLDDTGNFIVVTNVIDVVNDTDTKSLSYTNTALNGYATVGFLSLVDVTPPATGGTAACFGTSVLNIALMNGSTGNTAIGQYYRQPAGSAAAGYGVTNFANAAGSISGSTITFPDGYSTYKYPKPSEVGAYKVYQVAILKKL